MNAPLENHIPEILKALEAHCEKTPELHIPDSSSQSPPAPGKPTSFILKTNTLHLRQDTRHIIQTTQ